MTKCNGLAPPLVLELAVSTFTEPNDFLQDDEDNLTSTESIQVARCWIGTGPQACEDSAWTRATYKGANLLRMMASDDATAGFFLDPPQSSAQSKYQYFPAEFQKWGYVEEREMSCDMGHAHYGMETALQDLGISSAGEAWKCCTVCHGEPYGKVQIKDQIYEVDGRTLRVSTATGAKYSSAINVNEGVIMMAFRYSPRTAGALLNPPVTSDFPDLQNSSDLVFGQWTQVAGPRTPNIRFLISWSITNIETQAIIRRALQTAGTDTQLVYYPGVSFTADSEAGKALLGCPNGVAVGFLLAQHKAQLGDKTVDRVTVFGHSSVFMSFNPVMIFHVQ